jgi:hypothetical protein
MIRTALLLAAAATTAHADIAAYSNFTDLPDVSGAFYPMPQSPDRLGFTFQAQASGQITSIVVPLGMPTQSGQLAFFEVYAVDAAGIPTTLIASGSQSVNGSSVFAPATYAFTPNAATNGALQAGQTYALTLAIDGPDSLRGWHAAPDNLQGTYLTRVGDGDWMIQPTTPAVGLPGAQIFVVPAPAGVTLLALATTMLTRRQRPR